MKFFDWLFEIVKTAVTLALITAMLAWPLFHALGINPFKR